ncbi:MAG: hypothetical protein V5A23_08030 [Halobacteriales archaeon]
MTTGYDWPRGFDRTPQEMREPYPHGFQVSLRDAFENVITQLERLGVEEYHIETDADHQTRNPDLPYADASPGDPTVVVRYRKDGDSYAIPCDRWDSLRDNAQAIAKYVDAKRALDRYGIETRTTEWETQIVGDGGTVDGDAVAEPAETIAATDTELYDAGGPATCSDCGGSLPDAEGVAFCPHCGTELP